MISISFCIVDGFGRVLRFLHPLDPFLTSTNHQVVERSCYYTWPLRKVHNNKHITKGTNFVLFFSSFFACLPNYDSGAQFFLIYVAQLGWSVVQQQEEGRKKISGDDDALYKKDLIFWLS